MIDTKAERERLTREKRVWNDEYLVALDEIDRLRSAVADAHEELSEVLWDDSTEPSGAVMRCTPNLLRASVAGANEKLSEVLWDDSTEPSGAVMRCTPDLPQRVASLREENKALRKECLDLAHEAQTYKRQRDDRRVDRLVTLAAGMRGNPGNGLASSEALAIIGRQDLAAIEAGEAQREEPRFHDSPERTKPCGCVVCICADPVQCHGCGAKSCGQPGSFRYHHPAQREEPTRDAGGEGK